MIITKYIWKMEKDWIHMTQMLEKLFLERLQIWIKLLKKPIEDIYRSSHKNIPKEQKSDQKAYPELDGQELKGSIY